MTQKKHTSGPWTKRRSSFGNWIIKAANAVVVMRVDREEGALLIEAAPDMLAALEAVAAWCATPHDGRTTSDIEDVVLDALDKARGEA